MKNLILTLLVFVPLTLQAQTKDAIETIKAETTLSEDIISQIVFKMTKSKKSSLDHYDYDLASGKLRARVIKSLRGYEKFVKNELFTELSETISMYNTLKDSDNYDPLQKTAALDNFYLVAKKQALKAASQNKKKIIETLENIVGIEDETKSYTLKDTDDYSDYLFFNSSSTSFAVNIDNLGYSSERVENFLLLDTSLDNDYSYDAIKEREIFSKQFIPVNLAGSLYEKAGCLSQLCQILLSGEVHSIMSVFYKSFINKTITLHLHNDTKPVMIMTPIEIALKENLEVDKELILKGSEFLLMPNMLDLLKSRVDLFYTDLPNSINENEYGVFKEEKRLKELEELKRLKEENERQEAKKKKQASAELRKKLINSYIGFLRNESACSSLSKARYKTIVNTSGPLNESEIEDIRKAMDRTSRYIKIVRRCSEIIGQ